MPHRGAVTGSFARGRPSRSTLLSVIVASCIVLLACGEAPIGREFDGVVSGVHGDSATISTDDGSVVTVDGFTSWSADAEQESMLLMSVSAIESAVEEGRTVHIEGEGIVQTDGGILATRLRARAETLDR